MRINARKYFFCQIVIPVVVGSSPISHPTESKPMVTNARTMGFFLAPSLAAARRVA